MITGSYEVRIVHPHPTMPGMVVRKHVVRSRQEREDLCDHYRRAYGVDADITTQPASADSYR